MLRKVGHVDYDPHEIVSVDDASVSPVTLDFLRLVTGGAEVIDDVQHGLCEPFRGHSPAVIELERKQHLVAPLSAAHKSSSLARQKG